MDTFTSLGKDLKNTDIKLCDLYFKAIKQLLNIDDPKHIESFRRYVEILRTEANANCEFYQIPEGQDDSLMTLLADNLYYRIAYVYRNSTLYSSVVAFHFENVLESNPAILEQLLRKRTVRICSLGCGPASDVVAVVRTLVSAAEKRGVGLDVMVTVVDADLKWKNTCLGVLRCVPMFENATWRINFIQADLSQFFTMDTVEAIQKADVVTLVKFSSEFVSGYLNCRDTITEISQTLQPGSLLFFLDRPNSNALRACGGLNGDIRNFRLVYEEIYEFHNLHIAAVERNYHLYEKYFGANVVNTYFKVFCRAWLSEGPGGNLATDFANSLKPDCGDSWISSGTGSLESDLGDSLKPGFGESLKLDVQDCLTSSTLDQQSGDSFTPSSMISEGGNNLVSNLTRLRSETQKCSIDSPKNRFVNKREKFDGMEFFRLRPYKEWHELFYIKLEKAGWNKRGLQIYQESYQEMWDGLQVSLEEKMRKVEDAQEESSYAAGLQSGFIGESIWRKFMTSKRELVFVKRQIYSEIIIILRGHLKFKFPTSNDCTGNFIF